MDLGFLNQIPKDEFERMLNLGATLDLELSGDINEELKGLSMEEKMWVSKIQLLVRNISQRHLADLTAFLANQEGLKENVIAGLQSVISRFHITDNMSPYQYNQA